LLERFPDVLGVNPRVLQISSSLRVDIFVEQNRHSLISGGVRIDAFRSIDRSSEVFYGVLALLF
jgi:hypothetical protein